MPIFRAPLKFSISTLRFSIILSIRGVGGVHGWCATCAVGANDSDPNHCGDPTKERWEPARVSADRNWGWCNELCDRNSKLLPQRLREVPLVVFEPSRCVRLLNTTSTFFGRDVEICAGNVQVRPQHLKLVLATVLPV